MEASGGQQVRQAQAALALALRAHHGLQHSEVQLETLQHQAQADSCTQSPRQQTVQFAALKLNRCEAGARRVQSTAATIRQMMTIGPV